GYAVVCSKQKLVYIQNGKAGSSSIRDMLRSAFGCSWRDLDWAPTDLKTQADVENPRITMARTSWLNETIVDNYTFFTSIREPLERFRSSYHMIL
ncbi:unnamed protein product, partial [Phaeothamnion confervicola]